MSDLATALRLLITGDSASAVSAIQETAAATDDLAASQDALAAQSKADAEAQAAYFAEVKRQQDAAVASGRKGLLEIAGGAAAMVGALGLAVDASEKQAEVVLQVQKMTGLSATAASLLTAQMQALGVNVDSVGQILGRTLKNAESYRDGATKATSAIGQSFEQLGISVANLQGKNAGQILDMIRDKIAALPAGIERTAAIMNIFGRGATSNQGLLRYLTESSNTLDEINAKAKAYGYVFTQAQLNQAEQFGALLRIIELQLKGFAITAGKSVVPALGDMLRPLSGGLDVLNDILGVFGPLKGWILMFIGFLPGIALMAVGFTKVYKSVQQLREMSQGLATIFEKLTGINLPQWMKKSSDATNAQTASTKENTAAAETNSSAKKTNAAAAETDDAALSENDAALAENDAALATNTADLEANDAARAGGGLAGASEDLGAVGTAGEGAAAGGAGAVALPAGAIAAGLLAGMAVQSHTNDFAGMTQAEINATLRAQKATSDTTHIVAPHMAGGGLVKRSQEGTLVVVGDGQDERVVPAGAEGGGSAGVSLTVSMAGANFYGAPSSAVAQQWADFLAPALAQKLGVMFHAAVNGSRR